MNKVTSDLLFIQKVWLMTEQNFTKFSTIIKYIACITLYDFPNDPYFRYNLEVDMLNLKT